MLEPGLSIGDFAAKFGLTPRAIRFYVQQKLIPPPNGAGRGSWYDPGHEDRLRSILDLQQRGHSLDDIRKILRGSAAVSAAPPAEARRTASPRLTAELWTRIAIAPGVEIHFDTGRHNPDVAGLLKIKELALKVFSKNED